MTKSKNILMHLFALAAVFLWALSYVMTRIAIAHFTPSALAFLRYLTAAAAMLVFAFIKKLQMPQVRDIPLFFLGGYFGFAGYVYFLNEGMQTLPAAAGSFIISSSPVMTALWARLLLGEKLGPLGWFSVLFAFAGVGVITYFNGGFAFTSGVIWVFFAAVHSSAYMVSLRKLLARYSPLEVTAYCIISACILLSVFAAGAFPQLTEAPAVAVFAVVFLGVFSGALGYLFWSYALSKAEKTTQVTNYMFVTPLITTFLGFVFIQEVPHFAVYIGGIFILTGVMLANKRGKEK